MPGPCPTAVLVLVLVVALALAPVLAPVLALVPLVLVLVLVLATLAATRLRGLEARRRVINSVSVCRPAHRRRGWCLGDTGHT